MQLSFVRYRQRMPLSAFQHLSGHAPGRPVDHAAAEAPAEEAPSKTAPAGVFDDIPVVGESPPFANW